MRALNVCLALLLSAVLGLATFEGGLRLLGLGPRPTLNRFDPVLGWSKTPGLEVERSTGEFDVHFAINALGLRDDPMPNPAKPTGAFRVLFLGDSFVLGYTVERQDLFVDVLERWWQAEGRRVDCINAGTEGWSTDQEVLWFQKYGKDYAPDLVVLCPYENDLYWNGQTSYLRFPKPRIEPDGSPERRTLLDPGPEPAYKRWAIGRLLGPHEREPEFSPEPGLSVRSEWACYFHETPEVMRDAYARTRGALLALEHDVEGRGARLVVVPIPGKECVQENARASLITRFSRSDWISGLRRKLSGQSAPALLAPERWSPDEPVERVLGMCAELGIETVDVRPGLKTAAGEQGELYFRSDFHFNPAGNRAFAQLLHDELDRRGAFPAVYAATSPRALPPAPPAPLWHGWMTTFAVLLVALSVLYKLTYRRDPWWKAVLTCGGMLTLVFTIALGGGWLVQRLPPALAQALTVLVLVALATFLLVKLGRRLGTACELLLCFTRRGHWYLLPLVAVLLTVGSLLVVAASSPLVAPFIYTLF